jgi:hypothetical protein
MMPAKFSEISRLGRALPGLLRRWWQSDRIRISPREGELLRLQPRGLLLIGDQRVRIESRRVMSGRAPARVIYECSGENGPATLQVELLQELGTTKIDWYCSGQVHRLSPLDITVYVEQNDPAVSIRQAAKRSSE